MSKIAFLFPGQGAQYVGMGKEFYENIKSSREVFDMADRELDFSISKLCFEGSEEELNKTENTQPAILTVSIAALRALEEKGVKAHITAGLSLGEYSSLVYSGALDFKSAIKLVRKRGKFMQDAVPLGVGSMAAIIGLDKEKVEEICEEVSKQGFVQIANYNCPKQIVIAGEMKAIKKACEISKESGAIKAVELSVSGPFHTPMLKMAAEKLGEELNNITFNPLNVPIMTNVTGTYMEESSIKETLKKQVMSSVLWENIIVKMLEEGIDTFIEIGPGKVLSGFVKRINRKVRILNVEDLKSLENTTESL